VADHSYPSASYYYKCAWLSRSVNYCFPTAVVPVPVSGIAKQVLSQIQLVVVFGGQTT
jgi:hypothetical protein